MAQEPVTVGLGLRADVLRPESKVYLDLYRMSVLTYTVTYCQAVVQELCTWKMVRTFALTAAILFPLQWNPG